MPSRTPRIWRWIVVAVTAIAAGPASADAAVPFVIDGAANARSPTVAVDGNGTAHFAWTYESPGGSDPVGYCQVPRNGTACTKKKTFDAPKEGVAPPRIAVHPDGRILIYTLRCCGIDHPPGVVPSDPQDRGSPFDPCDPRRSTDPEEFRDPNVDYGYLYESTDGGSTWAPDFDYYPNGFCDIVRPRVVGSLEPSFADVVPGPGEFSLAVVGAFKGETHFQATPLNGFAYTDKFAVRQKANLGAGYYGSVAFIDPQTPIVAMSDLANVYFSRYKGGPEFNETSNWQGQQLLGPGDEPELAGGKRGVHLIYKTRDGQRRFVTRRFDGSGFGPPQDLTTVGGDSIFADFFQDAGGNLNFVWMENGPDELRYRVSKDGKTWGPVKKLASPAGGQQFFNNEISAARDAGGFVTWDQNSKGPIQAVQFGPTGPVSDGGGAGGCVPQVKVGGATVVAREGCLQKSGSKYTAGGDVRVNGIDLYPTSGTKVVADTTAKTITSNASVETRIGHVILDKAKVEWRVPASGQLLDLAGNPARFDTEDLNAEGVLGLPILGDTEVKINADGSADIPVHFGLPDPFGGLGGLGEISGAATLHANLAQGLVLKGLRVEAEDVGLGIATIDKLVIDYKADPSLFYGQTVLSLPISLGGLEAEFGLKQGNFDYGKAAYTPPGDGILLATAVYLRKIAIEVGANPTMIGGGVTLGGGPKLGNVDLVKIEANMSYTFPDAPAPGVFRIQGLGYVVDIKVADLLIQYETSGKFTFAGHLGIGSEPEAGIFFTMESFLDLQKQLFEMYGDAKLCVAICAGGTVIANNNVLIGCVDIPPFGLKLEWSEIIPEPIAGCDVDDYRLVQSARFAQSGIHTINVRAGLPRLAIEATGRGAPPRLTVSGPDGRTIATPSDQSVAVNNAVGFMASERRSNKTIISLNNPPAGAWTITTQPGSAPIADLKHAEGLPEPKVSAKVRGRGRRRTLSFESKNFRKGERIRFAEEGRGAASIIGGASTRRGTIRFRPANGAAGRRTIFATVEQNGLPRKRIAVATYTAPGPVRAGRPRNVRLKRRGNRLLVTWGRAKNATRYAVRIRVADGRRQIIPVKKRRLVIPDVPGVERGTIAVMGLRPDNSAGPAATARLKAKPKKRKRRVRR